MTNGHWPYQFNSNRNGVFKKIKQIELYYLFFSNILKSSQMMKFLSNFNTENFYSSMSIEVLMKYEKEITTDWNTFKPP